MLQAFLTGGNKGDHIFTECLKQYLGKYQYATARDVDLWNSIDDTLRLRNRSLSVSVLDLMKSWTRQAGYPVVSVSDPVGSGVSTGSTLVVPH